MSKIKCSVDNCIYFKNNICTADEIEVNKDIQSSGGYDMEAAVFDNTGISRTSNETKCATFKPKKSK